MTTLPGLQGLRGRSELTTAKALHDVLDIEDLRPCRGCYMVRRDWKLCRACCAIMS